MANDQIPLQHLALHFSGERLTAVQARFPAQRFAEVASKLAHLHGAAESDSTGTNGLYLWKHGSQVMRLERTLRGGLASSLIISERSFLSELIEP